MKKLDPESFREVVTSCLPEQPNAVTLDTAFASLAGWDSMARLSLIASVDGDFGLDLSSNELRDCHRLKDLYEVLQRKSAC